MSKEALKLALEALEELIPLCDPGFSVCYDVNKAITALREALTEQPAQQEPVAYWIPKAEQFCIADQSGRPFAKAWEPLYTSPPAQRKPLTDEEIADIATSHPLTWVNLNTVEHRRYFARAIEAKMRSKNEDRN